jgi:hypothetical protein
MAETNCNALEQARLATLSTYPCLVTLLPWFHSDSLLERSSKGPNGSVMLAAKELTQILRVRLELQIQVKALEKVLQGVLIKILN